MHLQPNVVVSVKEREQGKDRKSCRERKKATAVVVVGDFVSADPEAVLLRIPFGTHSILTLRSKTHTCLHRFEI
jgi:hypothetical protein